MAIKRRASRRHALRVRAAQLVGAIRDSDQATVNAVILRLSRSRRWLAPLALAVGAFAMLLEGVRLLFTNWRLTLIQVLPATWIWLAMLDLKAHVLRGKQFHVLDGPAAIAVVLAIAAITAASFFLNAVFAYAITGPLPPLVRPAFAQAREHAAVVLGSGAVVGVLLGLSTVVASRRSLAWFAISLSVVVAVMMLCYVAVPARLIGVRPVQSRRDKLTATAVGGVIGAVVCAPSYILGRVGLLMLGSHTFFVPGVIVFAIGVTLQAGATGAVSTVKMSATLVSGHRDSSILAPSDGAPPAA